MRKSIPILILATLAAFGNPRCPEPVGAKAIGPAPNPVPWLSLLLGDDAPGLDRRPINTACIAPERATAGTGISLTTPYPNLPAFTQPTAILQAPGDDSRWFVLEKAGRIRTFDNDPAAASAALWLDIHERVNTRSEGGLLGMAFHPDWPAVKEFFVSYTGNPGGPMVSYLSRMVIIDDRALPRIAEEQVLLTVDQDFDNHNGGAIAFGLDRYLYLGLGDGGSAGDPNRRAQDTTRLLGAFLRIDVLGVAYPSPGYLIPADNPFSDNPRCGPAANADDCPEIYAWGFRNPWGWHFDRTANVLWAGDVGQNRWEEVDIVERGGNYGWDCREGSHDYEPTNCAPDTLLIDPVAEYDHDLGNSITGGFVYRGSAIPELAGRYIFGDFGSGRIWTLQEDGAGGYLPQERLDSSYNIVAFAEDRSGEMYLLHFGGTILKLEQVGSPVPDTVAERLSETGCVNPNDPMQPSVGLVPYAINAPFWSDGADKQRFLALPDGTAVTIEADGNWGFPGGAVIVKHFALDARRIETRLLMRHPDGQWAGYTYAWNDEQTEATRVRGGQQRRIEDRTWIYPSEAQCLQCHTAAAGYALGPETAQLNRSFTYPVSGRTANQLATLDHIGIFTEPLLKAPTSMPTLSDPLNPAAPLGDRARAYLHTNCSQCHRPGGPTPGDMDLRHDTTLVGTGSCNAIPLNGNLNIADARIIAPGNSQRSVLLARIGRRDVYGMPPLASNRVDVVGVTLISDWIDTLEGCSP